MSSNDEEGTSVSIAEFMGTWLIAIPALLFWHPKGRIVLFCILLGGAIWFIAIQHRKHRRRMAFAEKPKDVVWALERPRPVVPGVDGELEATGRHRRPPPVTPPARGSRGSVLASSEGGAALNRATVGIPQLS